MLNKKYVKSRNVVRVTFDLPSERLPGDVEIHSVALAGEFNEWDLAATPMKFDKKADAYRVRLDLQPGQQYQFRYVINGEHWCNDWQADDYTPNMIDGDNCIVDTNLEM